MSKNEPKRFVGFYLNAEDWKLLVNQTKAESRSKAGHIRKLIRDAASKGEAA